MNDDIERMAVNRYRTIPSGHLFTYNVVAGDGTRSLFSGTKDACKAVARQLTEAFLDGAHVAVSAQPAATLALVDWRIDTSAGRPILVYKNCSVIESEQAEYVLRLIAADQASGQIRDADGYICEVIDAARESK